MLIDVVADGHDQLLDIAKHAAPQTSLREVAEEALDHVEPRTAGRREVHVEARMPRQPAPDLGVLVRRGVIDDEVQVLVGWRDVIDDAQEFQPLLVPVSVIAHADDRAIERVERREQRRRAVPFVVVRHRAAAPPLQRQPRLRAIERLDLTLLIHAQDERVLGRIEIQPNDRLDLLGERRIATDLERAREMRLQAVPVPDAANAASR